MAGKWGTMVKEEHIALHEYMTAFATKAVLQCVMGSYFTDDKEVLAFKHSFDQVNCLCVCVGVLSKQMYP